jgi:hypothetical protein
MGRPQVRVSLRWSIRVRFCLFSLMCRRHQDSNPIVHVHLRPSEQVSGTVVFAILHREKVNKVFGKRSSRNCSQTTTSSTSWWHLRPGDRSRDFTAYIFLHRHRTTTSTEVLPWLVWLIQRITTHRLPPATVPSWVHSHLVVVLFVRHDQSALSVYCMNRAFTSCYDLWYEFSTHA